MASVPTNTMTQTSWAMAFLQELGDPLTQANIDSVVRWEGREGGNWKNSAKYNPLNTSQQYGGSVNYNTGSAGRGVQAYESWEDGLAASVKTIQNGLYPDLLSALASGNGFTGNYQGFSTWSNGGYSTLPGPNGNNGIVLTSADTPDDTQSTKKHYWQIHALGVTITLDPLLWGGLIVIGAGSVIAGASFIAIGIGKESPTARNIANGVIGLSGLRK